MHWTALPTAGLEFAVMSQTHSHRAARFEVRFDSLFQRGRECPFPAMSAALSTLMPCRTGLA